LNQTEELGPPFNFQEITMNTNPLTRRVTAAMSGSLVAAGLLLGSLVVGEVAAASAQPASDSQCASMPMTSGQAPDSNALTRAGQISAAAGPSASDGSMAVNCQAASHG
jgi:hypothetical protein